MENYQRLIKFFEISIEFNENSIIELNKNIDIFNQMNKDFPGDKTNTDKLIEGIRKQIKAISEQITNSKTMIEKLQNKPKTSDGKKKRSRRRKRSHKSY
jgi:hypothetical protein